MSRFRLRFLLQEFDLPVGEVLIGRSPDCHITIEDPLISRQHAKIVVYEGRCTLVDLHSRNGSRLNGRPVRDPVDLKDADRIRIGAQELVFFEMSTEKRSTRATGAMRLCSHCGSPYAEGAEVCPHCAAPATKEEDTMSGVVVEPRRAWVLELVGEVLERAIAAGKTQEAARILSRAADEFSERARHDTTFDVRALAQISEHALRLAATERDTQWVRWVTETHAGLHSVPALALVPAFAAAAAANDESRALIVGLARTLSGQTLSPLEASVVSSLQSLAPSS
ncbi:MAG: FHA domain-containing protein [Myxococcales bacterium]|nr:FHA domain-containing protein [Myxococcales bacterium]